MRTIPCMAVLAILASAAAQAQPLTGDMRDKFVSGGIPSCIDSARKSLAGNEQFTAKAGITDERIQSYCSCQMNALADRITPDEFGQVVRTGQAPDTIKTYASEANKTCGPVLLGKPPE